MKEIFFKIVLLIIITTTIFWEYLFNKKIFVFIDVGHDFLLNIWPFYLNSFKLIRSASFPIYSLEYGLGTNIFAGVLTRTSIVDPFLYIFLFFSENNFVTIIPWIILIKIIISALLISYLLNKLIQNYDISFLGGISYALSSQMIVRSGWYHYTTEMVFLPIFLIAIYFLEKNISKYLIILPFVWLGLYHSYYFFIYTLFGYLFLTHLHLIDNKRFNYLQFRRKSLEYFHFSLLGSLISAPIFLPTLYNLLNSSRNPEVGIDFFQLDNLIAQKSFILTSIGRFFSSDLLGYAYRFSGWENYLEAPILYFGLLPLTVLSLSVLFYNKIEKIIFISEIILVLMYLFITPITQFFNGFNGLSYKTSSFFIIILGVYHFSFTLKKIIEFDTPINKFKLFIHSIIPVIILSLLYLYIYSFEIDLFFENNVLFFSLIFLVLYSFVINLIQNHFIREYLLNILIISFIVELVIFSRFSIQNRITLNFNDISDIGAKESSLNQIVSKLKEIDNSFYRIEKDFGLYGPFYPNDSAAIGYNGTGVYHSFNSSSFEEFMSEFDLLNADFSYRFFSGFSDNDIDLRRLLGVKYYLSHKDTIANYQKIGSHKAVNIFYDDNVIEFGTLYFDYIPYSELDKLSANEKKYLVSSKIFVPDKFLIDKIKLLNNKTQQKSIKSETDIISIHNFKIEGTITTESSGIIFFPILFDEGWKLYLNRSEIPIFPVNYGLSGAFIEEGEYYFELKYVQPFLKIGVIISSMTLLFIIIYLIFTIAKRDTPNGNFKNLVKKGISN